MVDNAHRVGFDIDYADSDSDATIYINGVATTRAARGGQFVGIEDRDGFFQVVVEIVAADTVFLAIDNFRFESLESEISVPLDVDFGDVPVGTQAVFAIPIENTGEATLIVTGITLSGPKDQFAISLPELPLRLAYGQLDGFNLFFFATSPRFYQARIDIASNDPDQLTSVSVTARGVAVPEISLTDFDFGPVPIGEEFFATIPIENTGEADLVIFSISDPGGDFGAIAPLLPVSIPPGNSVPLDLFFFPSFFGEATATIDIASNDPVNPLASLSITGTGVGNPQISVADLDFGVVQVGDSEFDYLTIENFETAGYIRTWIG